MSDSLLTSLNSRLARLEKEARWWRRSALGALAVFGFVVLVAAAPARIPDEIRAKRFVVVEDGQVRAELGKLTGPGTGLVLNDTRGSIRVRLVVLPYARPNPGGPLRIEEETWLQFYDPESYGRVLLQLDNEAGPELRLSGSRGPNAALGVSLKTPPNQAFAAGGDRGLSVHRPVVAAAETRRYARSGEVNIAYQWSMVRRDRAGCGSGSRRETCA